MNQLIRFCMLSLMIMLISACGGGGGEDGGNNNQAPSINSLATPSVAENTTAVITVTATDADGDSPTFSITGGADAARFSIVSATGVLTFIAAPDFENPADTGTNNVYDLQVTADDGNGGTVMQNIAVTVSDANDAPSVTSGAALTVPENTTAVTTVTASDDDGDSPTFSISGGADAARFSIVSATGVLTFIAAPDFENPTDAGTNNIYDLQVTADDGNGGTVVQNIAVTVSNNGIDAPPGIYGGTITATGGTAHNATGLITSNGKLALLDLVTFEAINGSISDSSITGRVLAPPSSAALTGTITSAVGNNIAGTYTSTLGDGSFSLDADSNLYSRGASYAKLLGTWVDSVYTGGTGTTTWVFQNDGSYAMTSTANCTGSGNFYLIDATKNEYEMDLALSNCTNASINGNYSGIATMSDTSNPDDTLTFIFMNGAGTVGGLFEPIKQ